MKSQPLSEAVDVILGAVLPQVAASQVTKSRRLLRVRVAALIRSTYATCTHACSRLGMEAHSCSRRASACAYGMRAAASLLRFSRAGPRPKKSAKVAARRGSMRPA